MSLKRRIKHRGNVTLPDWLTALIVPLFRKARSLKGHVALHKMPSRHRQIAIVLRQSRWNDVV